MSKYYTPTELELMKAVASGDDVYWAGNEVNQLMKDNKGIKTRISFGHLVDPSKRLSYFLAINNQEDKIKSINEDFNVLVNTINEDQRTIKLLTLVKPQPQAQPQPQA